MSIPAFVKRDPRLPAEPVSCAICLCLVGGSETERRNHLKYHLRTDPILQKCGYCDDVLDLMDDAALAKAMSNLRN